MKKSLPKISIITPSLNQARYIKQTILSVFSQHYSNLEYIVIDGASTDGTVEILKQFSKRKDFKWISEQDKGQADAINKGLRMSTGDIITYINSDDYYLPNVLHRVVDYFESQTSSMWVTGDYQIVDKIGRRIQLPIIWYKSIFRLFPTYLSLCITNFIAQPSTFWRREVVNNIGFFDEKLSYVFDYDYWMRIIKKYPLSVIHKPLSVFRIYEESKGGGSYRKQFEEENRLISRHINSEFMIKLHRLHNALIVKTYSYIK